MIWIIAPPARHCDPASVSTASLRWVRPLHSIICTFGPETEDPDVIGFDIDGIVSGDVTRGHRFMAGGPQNPLGARAMYLGSSLYRIHGSNEPHTIGTAVSSGCFRMTNEDVMDLYARVRVGTRVVVTR